jgi:hypothetical protein
MIHMYYYGSGDPQGLLILCPTVLYMGCRECCSGDYKIQNEVKNEHLVVLSPHPILALHCTSAIDEAS